MTVAEWFDDHPKAQAAAVEMAPAASSRQLLAYLQDAYAYPFEDHTAIWKRFGCAKKRERVKEEFFRSTRHTSALGRCRDLVVSCAVSQPTQDLADGSLDETMLAAMHRAADDSGATIACLPVRYKNPTYRGEARGDEVWPEALREYMIENEIRPHPLLSIMATRIQATASDPLPRRLYRRTGVRSALYGHPQLAVRSAPRHHGRPKLLRTTGAVTEPTGSTTLQGDIAADDHVKSYVKIEVRGDDFWMREVMWDGESFIDLGRRYTAEGSEDAPPALGMVLGDRHKGHDDPLVEEAIWGPGGAVEIYEPEVIVWHDAYDGAPICWQEKGNTRRAFALAELAVSAEVRNLREYWNELAHRARRHIVVPDNHGARLDTWINGNEPRDIDEFYFHWLKWRTMAAAQTGDARSALDVALTEAHEYFSTERPLDSRFEFPGIHDKCFIGRFKVNAHGHLGPDGARGSPGNLVHTECPQISGHIHGGGIWKWDRWVGIAGAFEHGYNKPPTSWTQSICTITANGMPQMGYINGDSMHGR